MAEVIIPGGFGLATLQWTLTGRINPVSTTLGYSFNNGSGGPTAQDVADLVFDATQITNGLCLAARMYDGWTFLGVKVAQNEGGIMTGAYSSQTAVTGTATGFNIPVINTAVIVQKKTPRLGRRFRGRMYWPPIELDESNVSPVGVLGSSWLGNLTTRMEAFRQELIDASIPAYLLHSNADDEPTSISTLQVASIAGTQRRRIR